jgi:hypothetical protein
MNRCCRAAAVLLLAASASAVEAADNVLPPPEHYRLRVEYRDFHPELTGEVQKGANGEQGTLIDVKKDLGLTDRRTFEVRGAIQLKAGHKIRLSYTRLSYEDNVAEAHRSFTFDDTRFDRFSPLTTRLNGAFYTAEYEWDLVKGSRGFLGALIGAKVVDVDWLILSAPDAKRETDTTRALAPVIGAASRVYVGRVSLEGELSGLTIGDRGTVYEAQASARVHVSDRLAVQGGYRMLKIKAKDGLDLGDLRLGGFQFGVELSL